MPEKRLDKVNTPQDPTDPMKLCSGCYEVWLPWEDFPVYCYDCMIKYPGEAMKAVEDYGDYVDMMGEGEISDETIARLSELSIGWKKF